MTSETAYNTDRIRYSVIAVRENEHLMILEVFATHAGRVKM